MMKQIIIILFFSIVPFFYGCRGDDLIPISGNVTLDDKPLPEGIIVFMPAGTTGNSVAATISGGNYRVRVDQGKMIVKIIAEQPYTEEEIRKIRSDPMRNNDPLFDPTTLKKQYIPAIYNEQSVLNEEINKTTKILNFNLKSKEK
jgi:hypothetical protein